MAFDVTISYSCGDSRVEELKFRRFIVVFTACCGRCVPDNVDTVVIHDQLPLLLNYAGYRYITQKGILRENHRVHDVRPSLESIVNADCSFYFPVTGCLIKRVHWTKMT